MVNREQLRLAILQALKNQTAYTAHQEVLLQALKKLGFAVNRDQLHIELGWLEKNANCLLNQIIGGVYIITLSGNGLEVAEGVLEIAGISKPRPDDL